MRAGRVRLGPAGRLYHLHLASGNGQGLCRHRWIFGPKHHRQRRAGRRDSRSEDVVPVVLQHRAGSRRSGTKPAAYFGGIEAIAARARQRLSTPPPAGTNTVLVAHGNVLRAATGVYPQEAEAIVFHPQGNARYRVVARLSLSIWEGLIAEPRGR